MNRRLANWLYVILIVATVLFMIFLAYYLFTNGRQCLANPLDYQMLKTGAECYCYVPFP